MRKVESFLRYHRSRFGRYHRARDRYPVEPITVGPLLCSPPLTRLCGCGAYAFYVRVSFYVRVALVQRRLKRHEPCLPALPRRRRQAQSAYIWQIVPAEDRLLI